VPIHTAEFELNKRRWYAPRGVIEKIDDIEKEVTVQHRAKLNRMMIANAPTFKYRTGSGINAANWHWIPGQSTLAGILRAIFSMDVPNLDMSFEREEMILRTWAEQYLGGPTSVLPIRSGRWTRRALRRRSVPSAVCSPGSESARSDLPRDDERHLPAMFELWHTTARKRCGFALRTARQSSSRRRLCRPLLLHTDWEDRRVRSGSGGFEGSCEDPDLDAGRSERSCGR